jgi:hypothetical protein
MSLLNNLSTSVAFSKPFLAGVSLFAWNNSEPACSVQQLVRNIILGAPYIWPWNRSNFPLTITTANQDYPVSIPNFGFLEKGSLQDSTGKFYQIPTVYNTTGLAVSTTKARPMTISIETNDGNGNLLLRFSAVPDQSYTVNLVYLRASAPEGIGVQPNGIASAAAASQGNTAYTGSFNPAALPALSYTVISGFVNAGNNGTFVIVSCSATTLVVANENGVVETPLTTASAFPNAWAPIPDQFSDIFNPLFLAEMAAPYDPQLSAEYRKRGMAALIARQDGLLATAKNVFAETSQDKEAEKQREALEVTQAVQARGV